MIAYVLIACAAATVNVDIAPDQPLSHVYADEPIVVEIAAAEATTAQVAITLTRHGNDLATRNLGSIDLRANAPLWLPVTFPSLPLGMLDATVTVETGGAKSLHAQTLSIIRRPVAGATAPAVADVRGADSKTFVALANIPLRTARVHASDPQFDQLMRDCHAAGMSAAIVFAGKPTVPQDENEQEDDPARGALAHESRAETLAQQYERLIERWELPGDDAEAVVRIAAALRRGGSRAPVLATVASPDQVRTLLAQGAGKSVAGIAIMPDTPGPEAVLAFRQAAEEAGYERFPTHYVGPLVEAATPDAGNDALHEIIRVHALTGIDPLIPSALAYSDGKLQPAYVILSGWAHRFGNAAFVGPLSAQDEAVMLVFRAADTWLVVAWAESAAAFSLDIGPATDVMLTDARNNTIPLEIDEDSAALQLGSEPVYLSGTGGRILATAATATSALEATRLSDLAKVDESPLAPYRTVLEAIAAKKAAALERVQFVGLLQAFSDLERLWHSGELAKSDAVPAMAALTRLVRALCILEQEKGEEFVESFQNIIAHCGEYQSVYVMGTGADPAQHERGDWLLDEVNRLVHEAESLRNAGRPIEAVAIASLAEARARALEFAAAAQPLSRPDRDTPRLDEDDVSKT